MNAVEIEEAVSRLAESPFEAAEFPFDFLEAFGNKSTTIKRLKTSNSNSSDLGGVLQRNNIHLKVCPSGEVTATLTALRESAATKKYKAKFILATDGLDLEAENIADGETIACSYPNFADHFGFFLPLAGITTVQQIRENAFDIKATGRLNRLYLELLKDNRDWDTGDRRLEFNHFMARLIFCFFAEDTNIFHGEGLFTKAIAQMSAVDASNTHEVIGELFRAMATPLDQRDQQGIKNWANGFPYVNGGLFSPCPRNFPHPLTPSPKTGEGGQENPAPLSPSGRGAGGEGLKLENLNSSMGEGIYWEIPPDLKKKMTQVARQFRKEPTRGEAILWQALRGRKLEGRKFRRQQPIGTFIVDFFCSSERLVVEVDGGIHESQREADQQRQELLESLGLRFVRVATELVELNLAEALDLVRQGFDPHPLAPSPKSGEQGNFPHPLAPSPKTGEQGNFPHPLTPSPKTGEQGNFPHPLAPSPKTGEGGQENSAPFTSISTTGEGEQENPALLFPSGRGAGGEGLVPRFSKISRSYLLHVGNLDWKKINPDIFGSMIQAIADEEERGALGMHYTSVPNILKVLNPLFLDDLRSQLEAAENNARKLLNLRKRLANIRVFDPACGSGNFLVIAYKEMRAIEVEINRRRGEPERESEINIENFRGIEIRHFAAEIARLALVIAEYQCNVLYLGSQQASLLFLPLKKENWITCGNALRLDWLSLCPPTGKGVQVQRTDLDIWQETKDEAEIDFQNEGGETYICGNPPYKGSQWQTKDQKNDLKEIFESKTKNWGSLDYVSGWFMKASDYGTQTKSAAAFVSTNSICQGRQVETLWKLILQNKQEIVFAHTNFKWANLASYNAGVTVVIVGISNDVKTTRKLYSIGANSETILQETININPYLISGQNTIVQAAVKPISSINEMSFGNMPNEGGFLLLNVSEANQAIGDHQVSSRFIRPFIGSQEFIKGQQRRCIWINDENYAEAKNNTWLNARFESVKNQRSTSNRQTTKQLAKMPYRFGEVRQRGDENTIVIPAISSENRDYLPCGLLPTGNIISNKCYALYDAPLWNMALIASRLHWVWIGTVCVRLEMRFSYSNTLGWNTFPVPTLTEQNKKDLTRCAEDILLAREEYFPATIAEMYDPKRMDQEFPRVREAHERNDETIERIYIGRRFKNDTERLEKLFEMYTKMTS